MSSPSDPTTGPAADLRSDLAGAFGLPLWGSRLCDGYSFVTNIGEPRPDRPRMGQWHLNVVFAFWRLETPDRVLVANFHDRDEKMKQGIATLDGKVLVGADVETPSMSATFFFGDGTRLRLFNASRNFDQWALVRPDAMVRDAGPDYSWELMELDDEA
ncbi:MAG: hypothetical protein FWE61_10080 [Micrococcales bacterium]|nr:hypothetical protein [Micrococcales bacterium]